MYKNTSKLKEFFISSIFSYVNLYAFVHSLCLLLVQLLKFGKVQTVGLADVDNGSDLSNICRTYIFFTTSTELHIYWLNP
jgi:Ran GTPase-activating protein (RanGAP) involved in mRNA processing and transport